MKMPADVAVCASLRVQVVLPPMLPPSLGFFRPDGAYLINNGQSLVVWLGRDLPAQWLSQVRSNVKSTLCGFVWNPACTSVNQATLCCWAGLCLAMW